MNLQQVILLIRRNQQLVLPLFLTFMVLRNPFNFEQPQRLCCSKTFSELRAYFSKPKDPITNEQLTDSFYSIPCNGCYHKYIGQTKRHFGTRLKEHQRAVSFCKRKNSALSEHTCLINHTIGWDNSKIITSYRCYHQRLCLEAWHINSAHAQLNRDDGGLLPDVYLHLLRKKGS